MDQRLLNWLIFFALCFIWGSSFILMKLGLQSLSPVQIAAIRIFSAGIIFMPMACIQFKKIPLAKMRWVLAAGFFGNFLPAILFALAITKIHSSLTGILNALTPLCVLLLGYLFFQKQINQRQLVGILLGFLGMCLLAVTQHNIRFDNLGYAVLILISTLSYGLNINFYSKHLSELNATHVSYISLATMAIPAGVILFFFSGFLQLDFGQVQVQRSVFYIILLGVGASAVATLLFYTLIKKSSGLFASMATYGIPFVAIFWGFIFGETIGITTIVCLLFILAGVFITNAPNLNFRASKKILL